MLELNGVRYTYAGADRAALDGIDLRLEAGTCVGLLGTNGAGKTTLLSLLSGLRRPQAGTIRHADESSPGLVPQQLAFYAELSVRENLQFFADLYRLRGAQRRDRLDRCIAAASLQSLLARRAASLSGGQQRRLNFALGLLQPARLYLFDEATVGVDAQSRQRMIEAVKSLPAEGCAVLYTSHYLDEIEQVSQRILLLDEGRVRLDLNTRELLDDEPGLLIEWTGELPAGLDAFLAHLGLPAEALAHGRRLRALEGHQLERLVHFFNEHDALPSLLRFGRPSLEQLYLHLCGGPL